MPRHATPPAARPHSELVSIRHTGPAAAHPCQVLGPCPLLRDDAKGARPPGGAVGAGMTPGGRASTDRSAHRLDRVHGRPGAAGRRLPGRLAAAKRFHPPSNQEQAPMTVTSRPHRAPARSVGAPPGHHDPALYQRFQRCGADLAGLLTEAERRARAAGHLPQATAYLRRWVAVQDQRRRTPPGDHTAQRQAIRRWSAEAAALRDLPPPV